MKRDSTTNLPQPHTASFPTAIAADRRAILAWFAAVLCGMLSVALLSQVPATHAVNIGGYDAAYTQGFFDPERADAPNAGAYLAGSDGSARWTGAVSDLLFPQAGLPARVTLRLRGWRMAGPPPNVSVLLNGTSELGRFRTTGQWEEHTFTINGGVLKPNDVVIELRSDVAPRSADDPQQVGVLVDRATYRVVPPVLPYPSQVALGGVAGGLLWLLLGGNPARRGARRRLPLAAGWLLVFGGWLMLGRNQPFYPYPVRGWLLFANSVVALALLWRFGPRTLARVPALPDMLGLLGVLGWLVALLLAAQQHVVLSVPGVENDFRVFATRSSALGSLIQPDDQNTVLRADGFYNLGYPFLLWLVRPLTNDNPFLAARVIAALSGALLLGATWLLARRLLGRGPALLALLALLLSPFVAEYGLYVGTDMPFAALCTLALACLLHDSSAPPRRAPWGRIAAAGVIAGAAFLVRHPGLLLLPFGMLAVWLLPPAAHAALSNGAKARAVVLFMVAFGVAVLPQLVVNIAETGQPLYNQQAKNVWLAVFGNGDWGRWAETSDAVALRDVIAQDPARFFTNWGNNLRAFVGTGGEDVSEFGRAFQLRLLGFPANWLALAGLLGWLAALSQRPRPATNAPGPVPRRAIGLLLLWLALYVVGVSVGLSLPRFFAPLVPVYALAAGWAAWRFSTHWGEHAGRVVSGVAIVLLLLLQGGIGIGTGYVLGNQPADQAAIVRLALAQVSPGALIAAQVPPAISFDKYSAIAHQITPDAAAAQFLIRSTGAEPAAGAQIIGSAGPFTLYRLAR